MTSQDDAIWSSLPVPAVLIDEGDRIGGVNPAAEGFIGASSKALTGSGIWDRISVDAPLANGIARVRGNGTPLFVNDVEVGTGPRAPSVCNLQIAPLAGCPGWMLMLISPRDLAGWKAQSQSVTSAAKSAIGMAEMLAHEIKNPLAGITGAAQLLEMNLPAEGAELTQLIVHETRRIVTLLDQVEQFGNRSAPLRRAVNIHDVLDRARRSALLGFAAHMSITEDYDPSLPLAYADGDQLLQVILNLIKNAAEAADSKGGNIRLRTYYDHSFRTHGRDGTAQIVPLQIEITDDGRGLPPDIASNVFDPFVSGRENGTGLGLALVSKIISDHDGLIAVESSVGRTVFRISLPRASIPAAPKSKEIT